MKLQTKVIACALLVISSGFVLANDAGDFRRDISESQQLQTREQPDKNPMLAVLPNMHPLSKSFALRQADLDGDEIPELLRLDIGKQRVLIEDKQGTWLGEVKSDGIIAGYSMVDVDGDGRLEILVMQQNEKRLLAYDYYGNSLVELEKRLQQLSRLYDELALARSIKFLHEQRVVHNDQGLTGRVRPFNDVIITEVFHSFKQIAKRRF
jgi:hypothetical protein